MKFRLQLLQCILLICFISTTISAQPTLYAVKETAPDFQLVSIDCNSNTINYICTLPEYFYASDFSACFDPINSIYYYSAGDFVYPIKVTTGLVQDTIDLTSSPVYYFDHIVFNPLNELLYGIHKIYFPQKTYIKSLNSATHSLSGTGINTNPFIKTGADTYSYIDLEKQQYVLISDTITVIDINSKSILYQTPIILPGNETFSHPAFNCIDRRVYGLKNVPNVPEVYFASTDTSGIITIINNTPLPVFYSRNDQCYGVIDELAGIYYFSSYDGSVYGIDIINGNLVYNHDFGSGFEFLFLQSADHYYCPVLDVEDPDINTAFDVFPSPAQNNLYIKGNSISGSIIKIFNSQGCLVLIEKCTASLVCLSTSGFTEGLYIITIDDGFAKKIIVQH